MPDTLDAFLAGFPPAVVAQVHAAANAEVVVTDQSLRPFRLHPDAGLASIASQVEPLALAEPSRTIVWCQSGDSGHGLDSVELSAVLGRWLHVSGTYQVNDANGKRVLVIGAPRRHQVAIGLTANAGVSDTELFGLLAACAAGDQPEAILFVAAARIHELAVDASLALALVRHQDAGGAIALLVPEGATESALRDPHLHLEPFARLGLHVQMSRFERGAAVEPADLDRFMRQAGLACDSSVPYSESTDPGDVVRQGAYSGTSPYRPQPFDTRVPWFKCEPGMWLELPAWPVGAGLLREHLLGPRDADLASRLDARRIAAFFRASRITPSLDRDYPDYRIYNWPRPAPRIRVTLVDGGEATVKGLRAAAQALTQASALRLNPIGQDALLESARHEVNQRYGLSSAGAIEAQNALHAYLADVPRGSALRQDYAEFARFAPAELGDALEIGSGYGVLAWALSVRSRRYVCADLDAGMFRALHRDLGQSGIVADAHRLPFANAAFDSVIANNVIEHLYDPLGGLSEIRRVLRPGGRLIALLPFDALNSRHELPAHLWKIDQDGLQRALRAAGLDLARLDIINLHDLGVPGAFPSCHGLAAMVDAQRPVQEHASVVAMITRRHSAPVTRADSERAGRVWPSVRELARFEEWQGRQVVVVGGDPEDGHEFEHFGARVTRVSADTLPWAVPARSADLVYSFLSMGVSQLPGLEDEIDRVLAPGGVVVAVFRNRDGLRRLARVGSYFGSACDLDELVDVAAVARMADDADAVGDDGYWSVADATRALAGFSHRRITISNLTPDDLVTEVTTPYPEAFWDWLSATCGRFVMVRARR